MLSSEERALARLEQQIIGAINNARKTEDNLHRIDNDTLKYIRDKETISKAAHQLFLVRERLKPLLKRIKDKKLDLIS